jgi:probable F420-dependent oxidoreductase
MSRIELGPVGAVLSPAADDVVDAAVELEGMGYSTIWLAGGPLDNLGQIAEVVRATRDVRIASGIISVDRFPAEAVAALYAELEATHPGRFVVGLGGAHGPNPLRTLASYLEALGSVPASARVMAALGPRMLEFGRGNAAGVFPFLITPGYTAKARSLLGGDTTLAIGQVAILEADPDRARASARGRLGFLRTQPVYQANFRRMGFTDDEIAQLDDRLVDALVAWGDLDTVVERIFGQQKAGADHVALSMSSDSPNTIPVDQYRQLAKVLIG